MHWLNDLGLPNQRRWLNHRTLGDEHRRTFPSAATDSSINSCKKAQRDRATKRHKKHKYKAVNQDPFCAFCAFLWRDLFVLFCG